MVVRDLLFVVLSLFLGSLCFGQPTVQVIDGDLMFITNAVGARIGYSYDNQTVYFDQMSKTVDQLTMMYNLGTCFLFTITLFQLLAIS